MTGCDRAAWFLGIEQWCEQRITVVVPRTVVRHLQRPLMLRRVHSVRQLSLAVALAAAVPVFTTVDIAAQCNKCCPHARVVMSQTDSPISGDHERVRT